MDFKVKDIADMLNLSSATVSLVVNNKPGISKATRQRVYDALEQLGLHDVLTEIQSAKRNIQFIVFRKKGRGAKETTYFSQIFSEVIDGVGGRVKEYGYHLMITYMDEENLHEQISRLLENRCEGILLLATDMDRKYLKMFTDTKIPMIVLDNYYETEEADSISINNEQGVYRAVSYLKEMGHREIGYVHSTAAVHNFEERYHGYIRAMEKCGLAVLSEYIFRVQEDAVLMPETLRQYFKKDQRLPTAIFTDNDIIAIHAIKVLNEMGIGVPKEVSVIGFDNMSLSEMLEPPLTTLDIPKYQMGVMAVNRLVEIMQSERRENIKIEVAPQLIVRKSVGNVLSSK